jgi:glycosyltransferase involved in cell wall biosynthesis
VNEPANGHANPHPRGPRQKLAFISTIFLLPADAGGKIRTGNILRGLQGGAFEITLLMPATTEQQTQWGDELKRLCDHFVPWPAAQALPRWTRATELLDTRPANVAHDDSRAARACVQRVLDETAFDVVVYDFVHAAVLRPARTRASQGARVLCFTHNVEAEILERHAQNAEAALMRRVWASQAAKMRRFEGAALAAFDGVIAVSERDGREFRKAYGIADPQVIPTGVDLDFFGWQPPAAPGALHPPTAVFTASMDSAANIDGVRFFIQEVWPLVLAQQAEARFVVIGRNPPAALMRAADGVPGVRFTGYVDDVREHVRPAQVFVMPLRVGGGTRLKAFEGMAMGCPVASTAIAIEGLDVTPGEHYLLADTAAELAAAVLSLFGDADLRLRLSQAARHRVESRFGHRVAATAFERICLDACAAGRVAAASPPAPAAALA